MGKWYISCQLGGYYNHRSHLLREPETTVDQDEYIPSRERVHLPPEEKENHLQKCRRLWGIC